MKKHSIIIVCILVTMLSCAKSKEVHPELGDGNDEIVTVGMKDVHVEYLRTDIAELQKVVFHYSISEVQQFDATEMTKREDFFELTLNDLLSDTLYCYYYELFPNSGDALTTSKKTFHTLVVDSPTPPTPPFVELPTVVTAEVSEITANSAVCGGEVTNDGGSEVTERGICWSTNANPTLTDSHVSAGAGTGSFSATISNLQANTTYHVRAYAINNNGITYGLDVEFITLDDGGSENHEYVDLGLPSGLLWATCNMGASSSEEYGNYYAWGETQPKSTYNWSTYMYGSSSFLTKYCGESDYGYLGFTDTLTVLVPEDDVATANWGESWRTPSYNEWEELYYNITPTWTTRNGVYGLLFTASNGNSLFLPAAGYRGGSSLHSVGNCGRYWTRLLCVGYPYYSKIFVFSSDNYTTYNYTTGDNKRDYGLSVRPVRSSPEK